LPSAAGMNDLFTGHRDQSAKNNFMTDAPWDDKKLEKVRNKLIRQAIDKNRISRGALIFDDTLLHKTGKETAYTGTFYDHCSSSYVYAQQIVTSHFVCRDFHVPLDFEIYQKAEQQETYAL
jgi:SRSO17 transposase